MARQKKTKQQHINLGDIRRMATQGFFDAGLSKETEDAIVNWRLYGINGNLVPENYIRIYHKLVEMAENGEFE